MTKIVKSFDKSVSDYEIEHGGSVVNYCSFDRLKPYLEQACNLSKNEKIKGITIDENGIRILLQTI